MRPTKTIHMREAPKDWRDRPDEFVYVGRKSQYGDGRWGTTSFLPSKTSEEERNRVFDAYEECLRAKLAESPEFRSAVMGLAGKVLVGFYKPGRCYSDYLALCADQLWREAHSDIHEEEEVIKKTLLLCHVHSSLEEDLYHTAQEKERQVREKLQEARDALEAGNIHEWRTRWKKAIAKDKELRPEVYRKAEEKPRFNYGFGDILR